LKTSHTGEVYFIFQCEMAVEQLNMPRLRVSKGLGLQGSGLKMQGSRAL